MADATYLDICNMIYMVGCGILYGLGALKGGQWG